MQVPCILGVNLLDVDLLEFLQQVNTDTLLPWLSCNCKCLDALQPSFIWGYNLPSGFFHWFSIYLMCLWLASRSLLIQMDHQQCHHLFSGSLISKHVEVSVSISFWSQEPFSAKYANNIQIISTRSFYVVEPVAEHFPNCASSII